MLSRLNLTLEEYAYLFYLYNDNKPAFRLNPKLELALEQQGYTKDFFTVTDKFLDILTDAPKEDFSQDFEKFWKTYPLSDKFGTFPKTRTIRTDKDGSYEEYKKKIETIAPDKLLLYLCEEINAAKKLSKSSNQFKFFKGPKNWLRDFSPPEEGEKQVYSDLA